MCDAAAMTHLFARTYIGKVLFCAKPKQVGGSEPAAERVDSFRPKIGKNLHAIMPHPGPGRE